jgi:hypothetical protein
LVAEYQHFLEEFWTLQTQHKDLGDTADALKALDPTTRAESRYAELNEKWDELQAVLERMKKRIQRGYTPEAEVLRAKAYIGELRGPKFAAPEPDRSVTDPAMDGTVVRVSTCIKRRGNFLSLRLFGIRERFCVFFLREPLQAYACKTARTTFVVKRSFSACSVKCMGETRE